MRIGDDGIAVRLVVEAVAANAWVREQIVPPRLVASLGVADELGDRNSRLCRLELDGQVSDDRSIKKTREAFVREFEGQPRLRIVIEAGGQSNWIARLLKRLGHEVIVANPRQLKLIGASMSKNDRRDAQVSGVDARVVEPRRSLRSVVLANKTAA